MKGRSFQFLKQESNIQATSGEVQSVSCAKGEWQVQWSNVRSIMEEVGSIQRDVVSALYKRGDWKGVMQLYENGFYDNSILWFKPSLAVLDFLKRHLSILNIKGVTSVGCGTGLFEWLLHSFTGLPVVGYELDSGWWNSKYSPPQFWSQVECVNPDSVPSMEPDYALLFCYFSNMDAFQKYLNTFSGSCVILIGPDADPRRFCDPPPFHLKGNPQWQIEAACRNESNEAIVIYKRT